MPLAGQYGHVSEHILQYVRDSERVVGIDELLAVFSTKRPHYKGPKHSDECDECPVLTPVALRVTLHRMVQRGQIERFARGRYYPLT